MNYNFDAVDMIIDNTIAELIGSYSNKVSLNAWNHELSKIQNEMISAIFSEGYFDEKYKTEIDYIKQKKKLMMYPYQFTERYDENKIEVYYDEENKHKYVMHNGKRLYFPPRTDASIRHEYNQLIMEQDVESPHTYFNEKCNVKNNSIFVDVGSAEGIISLDVIDKVSEVYLIECSDEWIRALQLTFAGYKDKVHFVKKYAGRCDSETTISLNTLLDKYAERDIFIKMDVEGMELDVLKGSKDVLRRNNCQLSCTTYHTDDAEKELKDFFESQKYACDNSEGYMLFYFGHMVLQNGKYNHIKSPFFRRAIVRGWKEE